MITASNAFLILITYLLGSIPFGYIITKLYTGKNILDLGSGNVGSTNVGRIAGKKMSIITQILDMLKGFLPVAVYIYFADNKDFANSPYFVYIIALSAIIGHNFSIFLKFKGGKGVNTTLGASVLIAPYSVFISVIVYFIVKWRFKYVSLGSIFLAITLPIIEIIINNFSLTFFYLLICSILIVIMHRKNISRLLNKNEIIS
ncbi:MAG: glycerol-3-phosphate 1-O-acyltransferase PlsY [Bacteroidales bacterium]|nr:glycerol-3-phosphate 1-O-acyltransferase PlsY [Bacteroidales bacterium]MBN2756784.1 glycerol-3-phosphate 1-O-acyltransferase PlsY [Bacteroidales bacterium]